MVRALNRLSAQRVARETRPGRYCDGGNLYLQVRGQYNRSWVFRFVLDDKPRWLGLGPAHTTTLAEAREMAAECRRLVRDGIDPRLHRQQKRAAAIAEQRPKTQPTFKTVAERYLAAHEHSWRNEKHRAQWRSTLEQYAYPLLGPMPVDTIETEHVVKVLGATPVDTIDKIETKHGLGVPESLWRAKPETASRVRGRIEKILAYATTAGWRAGPNPAQWSGHLSNVLPPRAKVRRVEHHPAQDWRTLPAFMAALAEQNGVGARALWFTILTCARSGEARGARWSEIDLAERTWTLPPERTKTDKPHVVLLNESAVAVLHQMRPLSGGDPGALVFPSAKPGKPLSDMTLGAVLKRMGRDDITVHGFRSSFRDWCGSATSFPHDAVELCLAHTVGSKVELAYRREDLREKRREIMDAWGRYCTSHAQDTGVVQLRPVGAA